MGDNDFNNAGNAGQGDFSQNPADSGGAGGANSQGGAGSFDNQGNPGSQNGQQTNSGDAELAKLRQEVRVLNKALVDSRRNSNQSNRNYPNPNGQNPNGGDNGDLMSTPEGQYSVALQIATAQLFQKMEDVYALYPEIPQAELNRIRRNPWAYSSMQSYQRGDVDAAALEIEQYLYDRVNEIGAGNGNNGQPSNPANGTQVRQQPAQVNNNPASAAEEPPVPGTSEDTNLWTMPLDKLERVKNKQLAQATKK